MSRKEFREITAARILKWSGLDYPVIRVAIARDALPSGLSMAMAPMLVKWATSSAGFGHEDYYIVQNVNVACNPVGGNSLLSCVKVYSDSVDSVEFVMATSKVRRVETQAGHGMLRFIFREDRRPVVLDSTGNPLADDAEIDDLVISWEAWRPPTASFDALAGLDPETYALTPRCLLGSVRCLLDSILDRPWHCYPLEFPDVDHAANELLYVSLVLADSVARQTVTNLLEKRIEKGRNMPEDYPDPELNEFEKLVDRYKKAEVPENPIQDILDGRVEYHLLERSCITMALSTVDWANRRVHDRGGLGEPKRIRVSPEAMPGFMAKLATGRRTAALLRMPAAIHWLMTNQTVIPGKAHELLDEVGLLRREKGAIQKNYYDNRRRTPYGTIAEHLIY